jgi:hypothetical protein
MKHTLALILLLTVGAAGVEAQLVTFGIGAELPVPTGTFGDAVSTGFGGTAMAKLKIPVVDLYGAVDYLNFGTKEFSTGSPPVSAKASATMWGINAGARISLFVLAYGGLEVGSYIITQKTEIAGTPASTGEVTRGAVAPVLGATLAMFDLSARYVIMEETNFIVLRGVLFL